MTTPLPSSEEELAVLLRDSLATTLEKHIERGRSSRDFARRLGLDKSLGWKLWRMSTAPSAAALLRVLPKSRGMQTMLDAVRAHSPSRALVDQVSEIATALLAARASAEKQAAETVLGSMATSGPSQPLAQVPRASIVARLAQRFDEDSNQVGTSLELRIGAFLLAPDEKLERVHISACTMIVGPRCYRPNLRAIVYSPIARWEGNSKIDICAADALAIPKVPGFVPDLSTAGMYAEQFDVIEIDRGQPLRSCTFLPRPGVPETLSFLEVVRSAGDVWAKDRHAFGSLSMRITAPTRRAILDIWVHRSLPTPDFTVSCREVQSVIPHPAAASAPLLSPLPDGVLLGSKSSSLGRTMHEDNERYQTLLGRGAAEIGTALRDFRLFRASVKHPVLGASIVADWPLPERR